MTSLSIDIETFSDYDLSKSGVYRYAESPSFSVLLFGYSVDHGPVQVVDIASGEAIPDEILRALTDRSVTKWAFNSSFERVCLARHLRDLGIVLDPENPQALFLNPYSWKCSMVWAATLGLPQSLEGVGAVLNLEKQKLTEGGDLVRFFCKPCIPTKSNGGRTRNLPSHEMEKWSRFVQYNIRDVETEMAIQEKLKNYPVPDFIWDEYHLDQKINDRGVLVDLTLVRQAIDMDERIREELKESVKELIGLENPNSVAQMKTWLSDNGTQTDSLDKKAVKKLLKTATPEMKKVLTLRSQLSKSSVSKYRAMENAVCSDGRARGMFRFYGANRTGRFSGRLVQLHNLPQNHLEDLAQARELVRLGDLDAVKMLYEDVPATLSQLIRTAFVPKDGCRFIVSDFSAIEARIVAWLAKEQWRLDAFRDGKDIYSASASQMFGVPVGKHGPNAELRQKGKISELALGYGGSVGALTAMGALDMGLEEEELQPLVKAWREASPNIVQLWWDIGDAALEAVKFHCSKETHGIVFTCKSGMLFITLPSGRKLSYVKPRIGINRFESECVTYEGAGEAKKWERQESYGPKFLENIVQGIARDILCFAMKNLKEYGIVMHVHDEVVIEAGPQVKLEDITTTMSRTPPWAGDLLLRADGYETDFYKKD